MSTYDPAAGFTGTPDPTRWAESQAIIAAARQAAGGASLDLFPAADFAFIDPLNGEPILAEALEDIATVTRASKAWSMGWDGVNGNPAGALIEHASGKAAWSPYGVRAAASVENLITNPRGEGAALPAVPTGWNASAGAGGTIALVGRGTQDGWPYVDVQLNGTTTGTSYVHFGDPTAAENDKVTVSCGLQLKSGSLTSPPRIRIERGGGTQVAEAQATEIDSRHRRWAVSATMPASTVYSRLVIIFPTGTYSNAVFRIFTPVLTKTEYLTHPALPPVGTPGASVKAQDSISVATSLGWYRHSEGTLVIEFTQPPRQPSAPNAGGGIGLARLDDGTLNGRRGIAYDEATGLIRGYERDAANTYEQNASAALAVGARGIAAIGWTSAGNRLALNGEVSAIFGAAGAASTATSLAVGYGSSRGSSADLRSGAQIHRIRFFPRALSDAELQAITTPHWSA